MEETKVTEEIRALGNGIFRVMHNNCGFDFENNIGIYRLDGKFTVASIRKFCMERGFAKNATCLVLVSNRYRAKFNAEKGHAGYAFSPVLLNFRDCTFSTPSLMHLRSYYRKADFDDDRKLCDAIAYVIVQNMEHLKVKPVTRENLLQRFKLIKTCSYHEDDCIRSLILRGEDGAVIEHYVGYAEKRDIREFIDGSGYLIEEHREDLAKRLKALKERRAKEAYSAVDYTVKVATIDALIEAAKSVLVVALQDAKDRKAVEEVERKLSNFTWVMRGAENFKRMTAEKSYKSIEESENAYNRILSSLIK